MSNTILLNGKKLAEERQNQLKHEISTLIKNQQTPPSLAVILVQGDPASETYVNIKQKVCAHIGIQSYRYDLASSISTQELLKLIHQLNHDPNIHGILVQLPLPPSIDTSLIIEAIAPEKDVDGFHPYNLGKLVLKQPFLRPCTPLGIMQLLNAYQISMTGRHVVIIGASNIVGRPMALECLMAGATTTICHRQTVHLKQHVEMADIVIVAIGQRGVVRSEWFHKNQVVIDVGIHRLDDGSLVGDCDFAQLNHHVAYLTPVPGGVGPMTVTALMHNTLLAYHHQRSNSSQS